MKIFDIKSLKLFFVTIAITILILIDLITTVISIEANRRSVTVIASAGKLA